MPFFLIPGRIPATTRISRFGCASLCIVSLLYDFLTQIVFYTSFVSLYTLGPLHRQLYPLSLTSLCTRRLCKSRVAQVRVWHVTGVTISASLLGGLRWRPGCVVLNEAVLQSTRAGPNLPTASPMFCSGVDVRAVNRRQREHVTNRVA